jgi:hypothetical protein
MSGTEDPLWRALAAAEQEVARHRAEFNRLEDRTRILSSALATTSKLDRSAAIRFLRSRSEDVSQVLYELVDLCLSIGWLVSAKEPIRAARSASLLVKLDEVVARILEENTAAQDYTNIADMLTYVEAWEILAKLLDKARTSDDPEVREVADDFTRTHGGMLPNR